jgi:nucleoid-associated protein YgaU
VAAKFDQWLTEEGLLRIQGWARDGLTDKDISKNMRIGVSTLKEWKGRFPEIQDALKQGKDAADRVVENALYKSACGYTMKIRKPVKVKLVDYDPETGKKIREAETWQAVEEEIHVPAQVTAQIFWLKNRKPDKWREKNDLTLLPSNGVLESILDLEKGGQA